LRLWTLVTTTSAWKRFSHPSSHLADYLQPGIRPVIIDRKPSMPRVGKVKQKRRSISFPLAPPILLPRYFVVETTRRGHVNATNDCHLNFANRVVLLSAALSSGSICLDSDLWEYFYQRNKVQTLHRVCLPVLHYLGGVDGRPPIAVTIHVWHQSLSSFRSHLYKVEAALVRT
jgi:hypothetical protein